MRPLPLLLLAFALLAACRDVPDRTEALSALRAFQPGMDTITVTVRVWADGPAWFSCAEVLAKIGPSADATLVRDGMQRWRSLVLSDWATLRDTSAGPVVEPGWCVATLRDATAHRAVGWRPVSGGELPSGGLRRGWDVPAGRRSVAVAGEPRHVGSDSASVRYQFTTAANASGVAVGANRDTITRSALLVKVDGQWRVAQMDHGG